MMKLLETGQALYVLAGICLLGILTRMMTRNLYKRLLKECTNLTVTKNKGLKELKLRAENTYRMNQGLRDSSAWLEHQLGELRFRGMTLGGWGGLSLQLTWLCLLGGGIGAFFSYWYRLDTSYIVMYGCGAVLMAMATMLFDNGVISGRKEQLTSALQDYLENVLCPRLARSQSLEDGSEDGERGGRRLTVRPGRGGNMAQREASQRGKVVMMTEEGREESSGRGPNGSRSRTAGPSSDQAVQVEVIEGTQRTADAQRTGSQERGGPNKKRGDRSGRRETAASTVPGEDTGQESRRDMDQLKRSLEQIAASRERNRGSGEEWMKGLGPEEMQLIGDILKEYLG